MASRSCFRLFFSVTLVGALAAGCGSDAPTPPPEEEPPPFGGVDPNLKCPVGQVGWDFSTGGGRVEQGAPTTGKKCIPSVCSGKTQRDVNMACVANDAIAEVTLPAAKMADGRFWMEPSSTDYAQNWIQKTSAGARADYRETVEIFGGIWGGWKGMAMCPAGYWVNGYRIRVEGEQGGGDDTAMNAVQVSCINAQGATSVVSMHDGVWGDWRQWNYCPSGKYATAANVKFEGNQGGGDDTAANDVALYCGEEKSLLLGGGGAPWGGWGPVVSCGKGRVACGIESRFEDPGGDDTAMNGMRFACCDAPGTGATSANSFRPLYQEVPYKYTASVQVEGQPFKSRMALWVTRRMIDQRVRDGQNPSDALPPKEAFVCTLTHLDVQKLAAGAGVATAKSRDVGELISPECVQGLRDARIDFQNRMIAKKEQLGRDFEAGRITEAQFAAGRSDLEKDSRYVEGNEIVLHLSFDAMGDTYIPSTTAANTLLRFSTGGSAPNPPGFFYYPGMKWVDMIAFYQQREIKVPWIGPKGETTGSQSSLLHEAAASTFDLPTKLLMGIKDFKLGSVALKLNPFEPSPPAVTVDIDWMSYGDIDANPYSTRSTARRVNGVQPIGERNLRAGIEIRPANSGLPWKNIGQIRIAGEKPVPTGSVKSGTFFPSKTNTKDLFSQSSGQWRTASMFDVRVCLEADGINPRPEGGSVLRLPAVNAENYLFSAGFESGDKGCVTKNNHLAITRDFLLRPVPPQRETADVGMADTTTSGGEDASGANDNGGEKICADTGAGRRCDSTSSSAMGGKGFFGRAFYSTDSNSSQTENMNGSGSASTEASAEALGFEVIDLDDSEQELGWAKEIDKPKAGINLSIEPNWDIIIEGLEALNPPGPPPRPKFEGKKVKGRMGLGVGVGLEATVFIGPIPGRLTASFGVGFSVALKVKLTFEPENPYPCTGDSNTKCFAASTDRKNQKDAAKACASKGARLAEIRGARDRDGIMAAAEGDQHYWIGGQLAYQYADLNCADPAATNVDREWCKRESITSYRWMGTDREFARSNGTSKDVDYLNYAQIPARPPGGVQVATAVPNMGGIAYHGAFQRIVTVSQDAALPYVCEFDGVGKTKYFDFSLGVELAVGVGLAVGFYIPSEHFGFGIEGTVDFITVSLTPTVGYREFTLLDNAGKWLGTRGAVYTVGPWEVNLLTCGVTAVANFVFFSAKWPLLEYPGFKVAEGKLWDVSWPTKQTSAMRPETPVEAPSTPTPVPDEQKIVVVEGETLDTEHQVGRVSGDGWEANTAQDGAGYLVSGPNRTDIPAGKRMATFRMKIDNNNGSDHVARLEVVDGWSGGWYASRDIYRSDFATANSYVEFTLLFDAPAGRPVSLRVYWTDRAAVNVDRISVGARRPDLKNEILIGSGFWGDWQGMRYCPEDSYVTSYRMRVEGNQGGGDDTALNSVELQCTNRDGTVTNLAGHPGQWGGWQGWGTCGANSYIRGAALKVEGQQGGGDDTAANSVKVQCANNTELEAPGGGPWGGWSGYTSCPAGQAVCGLEVRIEGSQGGGDDTGMNGLKFVCCEYLRSATASQRKDFAVDSSSTGAWAGSGRETATCPSGTAVAGLSKHTDDSRSHGALCGTFAAIAGPQVAVLSFPNDQRRTQRGGDWAPNENKLECGLNEYVSGISQAANNGGIQSVRCSSGGGSQRNCERRALSGGTGYSGTFGDWDPNFFKTDCPAGKGAVGVSVIPGTYKAASVLCCEL